MNFQSLFLGFLILMTLCSYTELKRKRDKVKVKSRPRQLRNHKKLEKLCTKQRRLNITGTVLELQAYFDLSPQHKPFACLKVSTCEGTPICFVTTDPYLKRKSINDTTTWQELVTFIQRDRKIEPVYDSSMKGWNGDKYKALSQYVHNQPAIYRMCKEATVYRFVVNENVTNITNNNGYQSLNSSSSGSGNSTVSPPIPVSSNPAMTLCPLFKRKKRKSTRIKRVGRTKNTTSNNFFLCQGLNCPCARICVGQGRKKNFTECSTFRIMCTFNCGSDTITVPKVPIVTKPTRRPRRGTRRPRINKRRSKKKRDKNNNNKNNKKNNSKKNSNKNRKRKLKRNKKKNKTPKPSNT